MKNKIKDIYVKRQEDLSIESFSGQEKRHKIKINKNKNKICG